MRYLRANTNNLIFEYNERLAALPDWEEVTEQEAYPERFAPVDLAKREPQVDITVSEEVLAAPNTAPAELVAEATRRPFKGSGPKATSAAPTGNKGSV